MTGSPPAGVATLADDRPDIERALYEMVELQWQIDKGDRRIKRRRLSTMAVEYATDVWIPKTAQKTVCGLRRLVA